MLSAAVAGLATLGPSALGAEKPSSGYLLVTNKGDKTLSIVDPVSKKQIAVVPEDGTTGHEVAASPDGRLAYVPIFGDSGVGKPGTNGQLIRVINLEKRAIVGTVDFGKGVRPHCAVFSSTAGLLYVTTELENSVSIIDPKTLKVVGAIPTGAEQSHMLAVSRDGKRGYTANVAPGSVSVLDLESKKLLKVIPIAKITQRIALSADDKIAFTSDQLTPRLASIDTAKQEFSGWTPLPGIAFGTAATPDGKYLVMAMIELNEVALLDLATMKITQRIKVPKAPQEVLVRPDGAVAYVSCDASKQVAVIDLQKGSVDGLIDVGAVADGLAWAATSR